MALIEPTRMMRLLPVPLIFLIVSCQRTSVDSPREKESVSFSDKLPLTAPSGWTMRNGVLAGPVHDGFAANVNLVIEVDTTPLPDYARKSIAVVESAAPGYQYCESGDFTTNNRKQGIRFVYLADSKFGKIRRAVYLFASGDREKHVFTCSVLASHGDELSAAFDNIIKTYSP